MAELFWGLGDGFGLGDDSCTLRGEVRDAGLEDSVAVAESEPGARRVPKLPWAVQALAERIPGPAPTRTVVVEHIFGLESVAAPELTSGPIAVVRGPPRDEEENAKGLCTLADTNGTSDAVSIGCGSRALGDCGDAPRKQLLLQARCLKGTPAALRASHVISGEWRAVCKDGAMPCVRAGEEQPRPGCAGESLGERGEHIAGWPLDCHGAGRISALRTQVPCGRPARGDMKLSSEPRARLAFSAGGTFADPGSCTTEARAGMVPPASWNWVTSRLTRGGDESGAVPEHIESLDCDDVRCGFPLL